MTPPRRLELITRTPVGPTHPVPLLFVHGAYSGAWCWDEYFLPWFAQHGFTAHALSLSGHGKSEGRIDLARMRLADYVDDVERAIATLPTPPVLIGHSMGGFIVQKCLERLQTPGAVLLCPVPPHGFAPSMLWMLMKRPLLALRLNRVLTGSSLSAKNIRNSMFHQPIEDARLVAHLRHAQPESMRAIRGLFGLEWVRTARMHRPPMLILGTEYDQLVPPREVIATGKALGAPAEILPDFGHAIMLERDWEIAAERILDWLLKLFDSPSGELQ